MEKKEPSREDAAEQEARSVEYKEKAEQLLKLHWQDKVLTSKPTLLIGILTFYLLLVYTVTSIGTLASSGHHRTTSEIFLIVSILLLLPVPVSLVWYFLRISLRKRPPKVEGKQSLLDRITQSPISRFLARLSDKPIVRLSAFLMPIAMGADSIRRFPSYPRSSLVTLAVSTVYFSFLVAFEIARSFEGTLQIQIKKLWEFNELVPGSMRSLQDGIEISFKGFEANTEAIKGTLDIIGNMNRALISNANQPREITSETEPKELDGSAVQDDKDS
jgi:hypothetical protein